MKILLICLGCILALNSHAGHIEDVLKEQGIDANAETFIPRVTWIDDSVAAYYRCTDGRRSDLIAEIWQGKTPQIQNRGAEPMELIYGELDNIKVFAIKDEAERPTLAAYLLLPSGKAHLFRVNKAFTIVKASMEWQCEAAPYMAPPLR
jgi:hypothetical protein